MEPYSQHSSSYGSISTRHVVYHMRLCYSHKIRYLIIWHALFKYLYIHMVNLATYGSRAKLEEDLETPVERS